MARACVTCRGCNYARRNPLTQHQKEVATVGLLRLAELALRTHVLMGPVFSHEDRVRRLPFRGRGLALARGPLRVLHVARNVIAHNQHTIHTQHSRRQLIQASDGLS